MFKKVYDHKDFVLCKEESFLGKNKIEIKKTYQRQAIKCECI